MFARSLIPVLVLLSQLCFSVAAEEQREWSFRVYMNDSEIGYHRFELNSNESGKQVRSEARFDVTFLFFNAFSYRHRNQEVWEGKCLSSIDARTDSNGNIYEVDGAYRDSGQFRIENTTGQQVIDGCVRTFAYWDPAMLEADALLNPQTGEYMDVNLERIGTDRIDVANEPVEAVKYRLRGEGGVDIRLWYTRNRQWLALESSLESGRVLRYRLEDRLAQERSP